MLNISELHLVTNIVRSIGTFASCLKLLPYSFILVSFATSAEVTPKQLFKLGWHQATTPNFIVISDRDKNATLQMGMALEKFRQIYRLQARQNVSTPTRPIKVIATKKSNVYRYLSGTKALDKTSSGVFLSSENDGYSILKLGSNDFYHYKSAEPDALGLRSFSPLRPGDSTFSKLENRPLNDTGSSIIFHHYSHYLNAYNKRTPPPLWYSEGLTELMSDTQFRKDGKTFYGGPIRKHLNSIKGNRWISVERILDYQPTDFHGSLANEEFVASSWLLVHYLNSSKTLQASSSEYIRLINNGESIQKSVEQAFGFSTRELNRKLKRYSRSKLVTTVASFDKSLHEKSYIVKKMSVDDVMTELAYNVLSLHKDKATVRKFIEFGLTSSIADTDLKAALAETYLHDNLARAGRILDEIKTPLSIQAYITKGHYSTKMMLKSRNDADQLQHQKSAAVNYNKAIKLSVSKTGHASVEAILGASDLYHHLGDDARVVELRELARELAPFNTKVGIKLFRSYCTNLNQSAADALLVAIKNNARHDQMTRTEITSELSDSCQTNLNSVSK